MIAMSSDLGEAAGAILGIAFGGIILLKMAAELNSTGPIDLAVWGIIFLVMAALATVLLAYAVFSSLMR
jgi:hypothetical protein